MNGATPYGTSNTTNIKFQPLDFMTPNENSQKSYILRYQSQNSQSTIISGSILCSKCQISSCHEIASTDDKASLSMENRPY